MLGALRDRPDSTPLLSTIDFPTLIIAGAEDTISGSETEAMYRTIPGSSFVVLPAPGICQISRTWHIGNALDAWLGGVWAFASGRRACRSADPTPGRPVRQERMVAPHRQSLASDLRACARTCGGTALAEGASVASARGRDALTKAADRCAICRPRGSRPGRGGRD